MEFGVEFERNGSAKCNNFSEGSFKPKSFECGGGVQLELLVFTVLRIILKIITLRKVLDRIEQ